MVRHGKEERVNEEKYHEGYQLLDCDTQHSHQESIVIKDSDERLSFEKCLGESDYLKVDQ